MNVVNRPGLLRERVLAPMAPAPSQSSGQGAVQAAARAQENRDVKSMAVLAQDEMEVSKRAHGPATHEVAGRLFILRDGLWTDLWHTESLRVVRVEPFSDAYFALLDRLPELKPYWQAFDRVLVSGKSASIALDAQGVATMSAGDLDRLARDFRGR